MSDPLGILDDEERSRLRRADEPGWRQPTLATLTDERFSDPDWLFERKLDGVRALAARDGATPTLWSRNRKVMNETYPELLPALAEHGTDRFIVDGEIVAFDGRRTSFAKLQKRINLTRPRDIERSGVDVFYYVFDLLAVGDADLTRLPLRARKRVLARAFAFADPVRFSRHRNTDGRAYLARACSWGWEGLIAKRADAPYRFGRTRDWLKLKCESGQEMVIGGYTEPRGSRVGLGALLVGYYEGENLRYAGKVGTGYDEATLRDLRQRLDRLERSSSPFTDPVREPGVHWAQPRLVAQIGFTEWTRDARLRHPRFEGLRHDKSAGHVVRERPRT